MDTEEIDMTEAIAQAIWATMSWEVMDDEAKAMFRGLAVELLSGPGASASRH